MLGLNLLGNIQLLNIRQKTQDFSTGEKWYVKP